MGIGQRIRQAVETLGLSLKQAAARCDISYSSMQNWAGGHRDPRPEALITIGSRLGISIDWLLTGEGPMLRADLGQTTPSDSASPQEQALLNVWRELDEDAQRDIQRHAEDKKRLKNLEMQLQELSAAVAALNRSA